MQHLKAKDQDALASQLSAFWRYQVFSGQRAERTCLTREQRADAEPARSREIRAELLQAFWQLFPAKLPVEERPRFPKDTLAFVRTQAGSYEDARKLYLGAEYGNRGSNTPSPLRVRLASQVDFTSQRVGLGRKR